MQPTIYKIIIMQPTINKTKTKTLLIQNGDIRPVRVNWSCELTKDFNWQIVIYQCDPFKSSLSTSCWRCTSGNLKHCRSDTMFRLFYANTWRYLRWNFISKKNYWKGKQRFYKSTPSKNWYARTTFLWYLSRTAAVFDWY